MVTSVTPTLADAEMRMGAEGESAAVMSHTAMTASAHVSAPELRDAIMQAVTHFCRGDFAGH